MKSTYIVVASAVLGSMLAGHAHAQGCWETDSCFPMNDGYVIAYDDYYAYVDPEDYASLTLPFCWETGTCYDGYYDPIGQVFYVDHLGGKWVSTDEYNDIYAGVDPEEYAEEPTGDQVADAYYYGCCYAYMDCGESVDCDSQPVQDWLNENGLLYDQPTPITEPAAPGVNPIPGIGQAAGNVVTHGNDR